MYLKGQSHRTYNLMDLMTCSLYCTLELQLLHDPFIRLPDMLVAIFVLQPHIVCY